MDVIDIGAGRSGGAAEAKIYTDTKIAELSEGLTYKGDVATIADLPASGNEKGDAYNVTNGNLGMYVWNENSGWTPASKAGPIGPAGAPAGIANATATIDSSIGTPSVTVTTTGPDTAKQFAFEFHNLKGTPGSNTVTVSPTGTSTNDVRYITIDGTESRFSAVALKAMKNAWVTGTTQDAATAILNDESVIQGDGFLATVYWSDLPGDLTQAEVKAFVMKKGTGYQKIIQFECTSGTVAPYSWFYNSYERVWRSQVPLNDTVTSTSTAEALTANMGKALQDQVNNLKNIGRFLAIWDSSTGLPLTNPTVMPYTYRTGDYYRVGIIASDYTHTVTYSGTDLNDKAFSVQFVLHNDSSEVLASTADIGTALYNLEYDENNPLPATGSCGADNVIGIYQEADGAGIKLISSEEIVGYIGPICTVTVNDTVTGGVTNYKPNGATYNGTASTTVETESVEIGWVYYYDGSQWLAQSAGGGGTVQDVQINGTSILDSGTGIANFTNATTSATGLMSANDKVRVDSTVLYTSQSLTAEQKAQARTNIGAAAPTVIEFLDDNE